MRIDLVFPAHPPRLDGIGDYTARLAAALADRCDVRVLMGQEDYDPIPDVISEQAFSLDRPRGIRALPDAVKKDPPDLLVLQYNPFSYGRWGLNPYLPFAFRQLKRTAPHATMALMVHEPFVPAINWKFTIMTTWQRWQLWMLGRTADLVFFSIAPWTQRFQSWFPQTPVYHLPVGSNIPNAGLAKHEARDRVGIDFETLVAGFFGSAHPSRLLPFVRSAAETLSSEPGKFSMLYIGAAGKRVREALGRIPLIDAGPLPPEGVSHHLAAMDIYLAPFQKGVSTRRGSFMAGIQHGVATVSTYGAHTDDLLLQHNGSAFQLAPDDSAQAFSEHVLRLAQNSDERTRVAKGGQELFQRHFSWSHIADMLLTFLEGIKAHSEYCRSAL